LRKALEPDSPVMNSGKASRRKQSHTSRIVPDRSFPNDEDDDEPKVSSKSLGDHHQTQPLNLSMAGFLNASSAIDLSSSRSRSDAESEPEPIEEDEDDDELLGSSAGSGKIHRHHQNVDEEEMGEELEDELDDERHLHRPPNGDFQQLLAHLAARGHLPATNNTSLLATKLFGGGNEDKNIPAGLSSLEMALKLGVFKNFADAAAASSGENL